MEFKIKKDDFLKVLHKVQGIVDKKNTMPILGNILLIAKEGKINVMATDLEIAIKDSVKADVITEGSVTINAKKLYEIVKEFRKDEIEITEKENKVTLKSQKSKFNILGLPSNDFPSFPEIDENGFSNIDKEKLKNMIQKTEFSVSTDETRYNINGFLLESDKNNVKIVTTDGHRLALISEDSKDMPEVEKSVILPRKGVMELKKLLEENEEEETQFEINDKSVTVKKGDAVINIRLIDGEFPDYNQVIPKDNDKEVVANREELLGSLKRVSLLSSDKVRGVKFNLTKDNLLLTSSSPDIGDAREETAVKYNDTDLETAFNAKYFIDVLETLDDENVVMVFKDQLNPVIIKPENNEKVLYIVMPMRL